MPAQDARQSTAAHGADVVRIENEAKLLVPEAQVESVWTYLQQRYQDCQWLDRDGSRIRAAFGDETFVDVYFDTPDLRVLRDHNGVRVRSRVVLDGAAIEKDGRELLQLKLDRNDGSGMARSEIKFEIRRSTGGTSDDGSHVLLGMVRRSHREAAKARLREAGYDPYALQRVLTITQSRRRVYLSDASGPLLTTTLDVCTSTEFATAIRWTEVEIELNEIRYTEAGPAQRAWMERVQADVQADLCARFPDVRQDQTPKYEKAFAMLEAGSWMPVRRMLRWRLTPEDLHAPAMALVVGSIVAWSWVRRARQRRSDPVLTGERLAPPAW